MLLPSPASTSILYRQKGPQGSQAAAASTAATASGAMNFGGNPVITASRFDDDAGGLGLQPIQFRTSLSSMREAARQAQMEKDRMALGCG